MSVVVLALSLVATAATSALAAQGYLGVTTQSTDSDLKRSLDLTRDGLLVNDVSSDSPADRAGLERGDVILTFNSRSVTEPSDLRQMVRDTEPGRTVTLGVWRDGSRKSIEVRIGELPSSEDETWDTPTPPTPPGAPDSPRAPRAPRAPGDRRDVRIESDNGHRRMWVNGRELTEDEMDQKMDEMDMKDMKDLKGMKELKGIPGMRSFTWSGDGDGNGPGMFNMTPSRGRLGVRVERLSDDLAQALGVQGDEGVLVVQVMEDTPAQKAGLRAGDVIVRVGDQSVSDPDGLVSALRDQDGSVDIVLLRKGARRTVQAELDRATAPRAWSFSPDGPNARRFNVRIPEPGRSPQVYRWKAGDDAKSNDDLREELRQLRRELQDLRREMGQRR
jgi:membrane-associated protease RseP (regulator of RpoE activity)